MSKFCGSCGRENNEKDNYCVKCGSKIADQQNTLQNNSGNQDTKVLSDTNVNKNKNVKGSTEFHKSRILESGRAMQFLGFLVLFFTAVSPVNYPTADADTLRTVFFGIGLPTSMYLIYVGQKILNGNKIKKSYYILGIIINLFFILGIIPILTLVAQIRGYSSFKSVVGNKRSVSFKNKPRLIYKVVLFVLLALGGVSGHINNTAEDTSSVDEVCASLAEVGIPCDQ